MTITYNEIKKLVRFKERDNNEINFSDYEIKLAVNETIRMLSLNQSLTNSDFLDRGFSYNEDHVNWGAGAEGHFISFKLDGVPLPDDYMTLIAVRDQHGKALTPCDSSQVPQPWEYKISGNRIYTGVKYFNLAYKASVPEVHSEDDEIALPDPFKDLIVKLTRMILSQSNDDVMQSALDEGIGRLIPKRRYRNAYVRMPFVIGR